MQSISYNSYTNLYFFSNIWKCPLALVALRVIEAGMFSSSSDVSSKAGTSMLCVGDDTQVCYITYLHVLTIGMLAALQYTTECLQESPN